MFLFSKFINGHSVSGHLNFFFRNWGFGKHFLRFIMLQFGYVVVFQQITDNSLIMCCFFSTKLIKFSKNIANFIVFQNTLVFNWLVKKGQNDFTIWLHSISYLLLTWWYQFTQWCLWLVQTFVKISSSKPKFFWVLLIWV